MPMIDGVIKRIENMSKKERCKNRLSFTNRKGEEYIFDNEDGYEMTANKVRDPALFPEIAVETPGMLTK
jgi:hypothetical protein